MGRSPYLVITVPSNYRSANARGLDRFVGHLVKSVKQQHHTAHRYQALEQLHAGPGFDC
jgi:hypothetical protein